MKLQFIGANHEVTGSCHYLQAGDSYMLVDYGMEQGVNRFENCPLPVPESQINFVFYLGAEHGVGVFGQEVQTVMAPVHTGKVRKLVHIPAGLHSKMADGLKGHILCQYADIEFPGFFNQLPGQISHLDRYGNPGGHRADLNGSVHDAAVVFFSILRGEHKQTVGQIAQRRGIFSRFLLLSESSAPAGPSAPCHAGPRPGPSRARCRGWRPDRSSWRTWPDRTCRR